MSQEIAGTDRTSSELLEVVDRIVAQRRRPETAVDWELGDLCNDISQFSRTAAKQVRATIRARKEPTSEESQQAAIWRTAISRLANDLGISRQHLVSLAKVAAVWPSGHWVRHTNLSLAHLKRLAPIKDEALRDELAQIAIQPRQRGKGQKQIGPMTIQELAQLVAERVASDPRDGEPQHI